eukprot:8683768-Alexandrium_andersonii.AAC.1
MNHTRAVHPVPQPGQTWCAPRLHRHRHCRVSAHAALHEWGERALRANAASRTGHDPKDHCFELGEG